MRIDQLTKEVTLTEYEYKKLIMAQEELLAKIKAEIEVIKRTDGVCQNNNETADIYYARGARFACEEREESKRDNI